MTYFKGPEDASNPALAYGSFSLENATFAVKDGHRFSFCFTIATPGGRVYTLVAKDQEEMDRWQRAINVRTRAPSLPPSHLDAVALTCAGRHRAFVCCCCVQPNCLVRHPTGERGRRGRARTRKGGWLSVRAAWSLHCASASTALVSARPGPRPLAHFVWRA